MVRARIAQKKKDNAIAEKEYRAAIDASHGGARAWVNLAGFYNTSAAWMRWNRRCIPWNRVRWIGPPRSWMEPASYFEPAAITFGHPPGAPLS